ncbi:MAG: hypothetical protein MPN21_27125 [Thermoanaerobaculia bacterium]|nr:hypothetical protein [Thermoanaerobaculia bacterium]
MSQQNDFPPGWDAKRVRNVIDYYEHQTEDEAVAEHEAALGSTTMEVPHELLPAVRELIAQHDRDQADRKTSR